MPLKHESGKPAGFTLIEIIVVIAVVAILASLVSPMVFQNVGDAKSTTAEPRSRSWPSPWIRTGWTTTDIHRRNLVWPPCGSRLRVIWAEAGGVRIFVARFRPTPGGDPMST